MANKKSLEIAREFLQRTKSTKKDPDTSLSTWKDESIEDFEKFLKNPLTQQLLSDLSGGDNNSECTKTLGSNSTV